MAAKKSTSKAAAKPGEKKPAAKSSKAPATAKPVVKKAAAKKQPAPAAPKAEEKPAAKPKKQAVEKKAAPQKEAASKSKPQVVAEKPTAKPARSSVVDYPAPPAQPKPPFVPPKQQKVETEAPQANANGAHSPAFILKQRQRLLDLRDELVDAMSGMTRDTIRNAPEGSEASGSGMHQGDAGSDAYDRDFALSVLAKEQDALYEIEQALRRIQKGTYGVCEMSSKKIPQARLEAIPFARLTVECQAQWEKEYGNRRFRPSNEVGFSDGHYADDEDSESVSLDEDED